MSKEYYDDDPLEDYDDDRYLRGIIMAHATPSYAGDEKHYCGFNDYSKFEDVLKSIEESIEDGTAYLGEKKKSKKHKKKR